MLNPNWLGSALAVLFANCHLLITSQRKNQPTLAGLLLSKTGSIWGRQQSLVALLWLSSWLMVGSASCLLKRPPVRQQISVSVTERDPNTDFEYVPRTVFLPRLPAGHPCVHEQVLTSGFMCCSAIQIRRGQDDSSALRSAGKVDIRNSLKSG